MIRKSKLGKYFKTLILLGALVGTVAHTVFAEELEDIPNEEVEAVQSEITEEESQTDSTKKPPQVVGNSFVWENGELRLPVELGDYTEDEISISIAINNGTRMLFPTLKDKVIVSSVFDFYYPDIANHPFMKKGDYNAKVKFALKSDYSEIVSNEIVIRVLADETSRLWKANQKTEKFDGTQDITFTFANGTDYYALQSIGSIEFFAWKYLEVDGERCHNFSVGEDYYTYDMDAGTLTLSKDTLKYAIQESAKLWAKSGKDIKDYPKKITINALGVTKTGESIYYLSSIEVVDPETGFTGTDGAWKVDITDYALNLEDKKTEFNVGSDQITVSEEVCSVIENNALVYVKENNSEKFVELGDNYKVSSKLNLTVQESSAVQQEVKDGFQAKLGSKEIIGQYYDINILADVLQNRQKVAGLENISINKLDQKITINFQIPEALRKSGRTYKILHYNNSNESESKAEELKSEVKDWVISFETDSFSPYALVYSDRTASSGTGKPSFSDKDDNQDNQGGQGNQGDDSNNQPGNGNQGSNQNNSSKDQGSTNNADGQTVTSPKTGDEANIVLFVTMILMASVFVGSVMRKKKAYK